MPRQRGRQPDDDLVAALEEERREWLRRDAERRETERREGLAPATGARTMLAALEWPDSDAWDADDSLEELARLVETAGGTVMGRTIQRRNTRTRRRFSGGARRPSWPSRAASPASICWWSTARSARSSNATSRSRSTGRSWIGRG